jgi:antitoxin (DNA-binding transcriptional repressor) of toxin-antitoxin stability system
MAPSPAPLLAIIQEIWQTSLLAPSRCAIQKAMKTLTMSDARKSLPSLLERVKHGEDIGIIFGDQIIQLKPVQVVAWEESYLYQEYQVTPQEWDRFQRRMKSRRAKNNYATFSGKFDPDTFA